MNFPQAHPTGSTSPYSSSPPIQPEYENGPYDPNPEPLPNGWIKEWDSQYNAWYFVNTLQDPPETSWQDPRTNPRANPAIPSQSSYSPSSSPYPPSSSSMPDASSNSTPSRTGPQDGEKGLMTNLVLVGGAAWAANKYFNKKNQQKPPQNPPQNQGYAPPYGSPPPYYGSPPPPQQSYYPQQQYAQQQYAPPPQPPQTGGMNPMMYGLGGAAVGALGATLLEGNHHQGHHRPGFGPMGMMNMMGGGGHHGHHHQHHGFGPF